MASLNVVPTTKSAADDTDIFSSNTTNHASYATRLPSQERLGPRPASSFIHVTSVASVARSLPKPGTHTRSATADPPTSVSSSKPPTHARSATADAASRPTSTVRSSWAPSILVPTENATQIDVSIRKVHPIVREMQEKLIAQLATPKAYSPSGGSTPANPRRLSNEGPHGLENRIEDEDAFAKEVVHKIGQITDAQGVVEVAPPS
ncbi:hypothetical protein BJ742DRAFT_342630 [Cladochytrium replicatum]|nr:hypothetical protein BJ742DRAFT_342630 [Cladochytrium replicatum]